MKRGDWYLAPVLLGAAGLIVPAVAQPEATGSWYVYALPPILLWFLVEGIVEFPILALVVRCCGWERLLGATVAAQFVSTVATALLTPLWVTAGQMAHGQVHGIVAGEMWLWTFCITTLVEWIVLMAILRELKATRTLLAAVCMNLASAGVLAGILALVPTS